jgi:tetratricopeptide (TPR) repeat protein
MGRLLIFCLSLFLLLSACSNPSTSNLEPALTLVERDTLIAQKYREFFQTHQGTPRAMHLLEEILELDSTNAEAWREMSIPYLKRGIPHKWYEYYQKAIEYDAENWIGWRGYCYLFFYRDYRRAIADFDATDTITPGFTDYPQAMSVHYLRGLCYYGLNEYENAQAYFQRYIDEEMAGPGFDFIDQNVYLFRGLIQQKLGDHQQAIEEFKTGLKIFEGSSDLYYHLSQSYLALGNLPLAKSNALKAEDYFKQGYYHHRPYIEVFDRIYDYDISELKSSLKLNN